MKMRKAEKKDAERLINLMDQLGYKIGAETLHKNLDLYGTAVFVAEIEGEVVGCLAYHILPQFHSEERYMRIVSLVVDQRHRNQGIGKKLLQEAEKIATKNRCAVIELTSAAHRIPSGAHAFYLGQGYKADGEKVYFRKEIVIPLLSN